MSSHIILPKEEEEQQQQQEAAAESGLGLPEPQGYRHMETAPKPLPFSATCVRISRDSYPNLRALRNASAASLPDDDAAFAKLDEGDFGYVLDDVQHLTDYLPELPVSAAHLPALSVAPLPDSAENSTTACVGQKGGDFGSGCANLESRLSFCFGSDIYAEHHHTLRRFRCFLLFSKFFFCIIFCRLLMLSVVAA
jgi:hypothetical protein